MASRHDRGASARLLARQRSARYAPAEPRALGVLAVLAVTALPWVLAPVGVGVLLGALLAFTLQHVHMTVVRKTRRPALVAFLLTLGASLVVASTVAAVLYYFVVEGLSAARRLPGALAAGGPADALIRKVVGPLAPLHVDAESVVGHVRGALGNVTASLASWAAKTALIFVDGLVAMFFMAITSYFVLRHWPLLVCRAERLLPINPRGVELFGVAGLFLGPVLVGVAMAVLRVYERTRRFRLGLG